jgi:predicted FMN-binding regulatory protein PaiB
VSAITGKFKGSQNRSSADRQGVQAALHASGRTAQEISKLAPDSTPKASGE